jgi:hypothetical protein
METKFLNIAYIARQFSGSNFWKILSILVILNTMSFGFFYWQSAQKDEHFDAVEQKYLKKV